MANWLMKKEGSAYFIRTEMMQELVALTLAPYSTTKLQMEHY